MKKLLFGLLAILLVLPAVLAVSGLEINENSISVSGDTGTLTGSFTLNNSASNNMTVTFEGYTLPCTTSVCASQNIVINTISNVFMVNKSVQTISYSIPITAASTGKYSGVLRAKNSADASQYDDLAFNVTVNGVLKITDVDPSPNEFERGETVKVDVDYENIASNIDLKDLKLSYKVLDGSTVLKDVDDEKIEDSIDDLDNLDAGDDTTATITFTMPYDVDNGKTYTIFAEITGRNADNSAQRFYYNSTATIDASIKSHKIAIYKAEFDTPTLACSDNSVRLDVGLKNLGQKDEDVQVVVKNPDLQIEQMATATLDNKFSDEEDYTVVKSFMITLNKPAAKAYEFTIEAYYNADKDKEIRTAVLTVPSCTAAPVVQEQQEITVVRPTTTPAPSVSQVVPTQTSGSVPMSLMDVSSGFNANWEVVGLVALFAVLLGATIGIVVKILGFGQIRQYK